MIYIFPQEEAAAVQIKGQGVSVGGAGKKLAKTLGIKKPGRAVPKVAAVPEEEGADGSAGCTRFYLLLCVWWLFSLMFLF